MTLDEILAEASLDEGEVRAWVAARWVLPDETPQGLHFDAVDLARLQMIRSFTRDLALDAEALPVVLSLIDQLHAARQQLRAVADALADQPEALRRTVLERCRAVIVTRGTTA
ncbi:chaperone modulator CbpM [Zavarzinia sp. CC-PAN008]|uniref:chaperone modulator CbpM n=1 Tax=Zavarzinia sp. CC-PAN008 TaxID=3243332 RepID=UPI003F744D85